MLDRSGRLIVLFLIIDLIFAAEIELTGSYKDQKDNSIANARVELLQDGVLKDSTFTANDGSFVLVLPTTSIKHENATISDYRINSNFPNPFNPSTRFEVETSDRGWVRIHNINGELVDELELPGSGEYMVEWGGCNKNGVAVSSGVYLYTVQTPGGLKSEKMTLMDGGAGGGLEIVGYDNNYSVVKSSRSSLSKIVSRDVLRFSKDNTSSLELSFPSVGSDTSLGSIVGNVGPSVESEVPVQKLVFGDTLCLDLDDFVYNDDSTVWSSSVIGFGFDGSVVEYVPVDSETLEVLLTGVDVSDEDLSVTLGLDVNVSEPASSLAFSVPNQELLEDESIAVLVDDLWGYVSASNVDSALVSYELLSESNSGLVDLVVDGSSLLVESLEEDGFGSSDVELRASYPNGFDVSNFTVFVESVNDAPVLLEQLSDTSVLEDGSLELDVGSRVEDVDDESLTYSVNELNNATYNFNGGELSITPLPDYGGLVEDVVVSVSDGVSSVGFEPFDLFVESVNDAPVVSLEDVVSEVYEGVETPLTIADVNVSDVDDSEHSLDLLCDESAVSLELQGGSVVLDSLQSDYNGVFSYRVVASDGSLSDTLTQSLAVEGVATVLFKLMSVYPDTLVTQEGGEFHIDGQVYTAEAGTLAVELAPGTYEFNATHENSIDGIGAGNREYLFIKEPGVQGNLEQRAYEDHESPITIGSEDKTILAYKIFVDDIENFVNVTQYLDQVGKGTRRFARGLDVPFWWNANYLPSDSAGYGDPVQWTHEVMQQLSEIPHCDVNMHYVEGTEEPDTPYLDVAVDESFPSPGTNGTYCNDENEITLARDTHHGPVSEHGRLRCTRLSEACMMWEEKIREY